MLRSGHRNLASGCGWMGYVNMNHFNTNDQLELVQYALKFNKIEKQPVLKFNVIFKNINPEYLEEIILQDVLNGLVNSFNTNFPSLLRGS